VNIALLVYVDDAKRYVAVDKNEMDISQFFELVQGYCDLLADLSLVLKMARNVAKCTITLYNIPEQVCVPKFTSIAWSYDAQGPVKGIINVLILRRDVEGNLICYNVPSDILCQIPHDIQNLLRTQKYLGVPHNAQLGKKDGTEWYLEKLKAFKKLGLHTTC